MATKNVKAKTKSLVKKKSSTRELDPELSAQQELFCIEYVRTSNASRSAIAAGYSVKASRQTGYDLLTKAYIIRRVGELTIEMSKSSYIDAFQVVQNLARIAKSDVRNLYDNEGVLLNPKDWDDDTAFAVQEVSSMEVRDKRGNLVGVTKKAKLGDKKGANIELGKMLGLYKADNEQKNQTVIFNFGEDMEAI